MIRIVFQLLFYCTPSLLCAQTLDIPCLDSLELSLIGFTHQERDAKLKTFDALKSDDWVDLLPSLGIAYTPAGSPRPSANWSPLQILDRKDQKKKKQLNRQSIVLAYEILVTDRLYKLRQLYQDLQIDVQGQKDKQAIINLEKELFDISEGKYKANLIKPSEYLSAKKRYLEVVSAHNRSKELLMKKRNELMYVAKMSKSVILDQNDEIVLK